jgi:hypothetical protein
MKICLVGAELVRADGRADGQTDLTKLTVSFRNFENSSEMNKCIGTVQELYGS